MCLWAVPQQPKGTGMNGTDGVWTFRLVFLRQEVATRLRLASRRDTPIVAWHEVPGKAPPQKSRPVGYGMIGGI
jgi:hypothetical protein